MSGFVVNCPHCGMAVEILEINCRIFRHGVFKSNYTQIPPHLPKAQCDHLAQQNLIYGCGKPFRLNKDNVPEICAYI